MLKTFSGRRPSQNEYELRRFVALLKAREVTRYLEIGAREGDTFVEIMESLPKGSTGVALDLPGGMWGKLSTRPKLEKAVAHLKAKGYNVSCLFGDSQAAGTKRMVVNRGPYDAVLIDGDHRLEGVTRDWSMYGKLGKVIAFHDIVGTGQIELVHGNPVEVPILWQTIKASGVETVEFIGAGSAMGIGVVLR